MAEVVLRCVEEHVMVVTINRPEVRNAVDQHVSRRLGEALAAADADREVRVVVLTGAGDRAFCAGADLGAVSRGEPVHDPEREEWGFAGVVRHDIRQPLIAAVNGFALGGGLEIVLHCDLAVADQTATFGLPEVRRGMMASAGGTLRIGRQVPAKLAAELVFTGGAVSAARAHELGLVNRVVPPGGALAGALSLAQEIVGNAPLSVQASKRTMLGIDPGVSRDDDSWRRVEREDAQLHRSADTAEGVRAFLEKREPVWTAR